MAAIPLSPIEHIFTGIGSYPIEFVFAYGGPIDPERLEASLAATLAHFPVIRSRLERVGHSYELRADDDGLRFETAPMSESFDTVEAPHRFLDSVDSVERQPLTRIRLTQTPGGSVLGVSMSHALVDGFSYFHFLSSWSRVHNGQAIRPATRSPLRLTPGPALRGSRITADGILTACGMFWDERRAAISKEDLRWDRFYFSEEQLKDLLKQARRDCEGRLSFNDVIAAWLWKRYLGFEDSRSKRLTYLSCPVDYRRIVKTLAKDYFGCAVALTTASLERAELADASIGVLAGKAREAVAKVGEAYVVEGLRALEALRRQEGLSVVERCHVIHPRDGILVTNLSRLPVLELSFDAGPPVAFDIVTAPPQGAVVLPAAGGVDVRVCRSNGLPGVS